MIVLISWLVGGALIGLYVLWFVSRYRRDKRKEADEAAQDRSATDAIFRAAKLTEQPRVDIPPARAPLLPRPAESSIPEMGRASAPSAPPTPSNPSTAPATTVAEALTGIALPHGLVPLTTVADAPVVGDRVVFWTDAEPAEVVGRAFAAEVERLGYAVTPIDERTVAVKRDLNHLAVTIYPEGDAAVANGERLFPTVPAGAVVLEVRVVF